MPGFDLVLLDLSLPDSEGLETFLRMQNRAPPDLPIVVLTGMDDEALAVETVQRGAQDYLVKGRVDVPHPGQFRCVTRSSEKGRSTN